MYLSAHSTQISRVPAWFTIAALAGVLWNIFGAVQFATSISATEASLVASGLTLEQAKVMTSYPLWMTVAFGIGVFAGLLGSALLYLRRSTARPVLAISLFAYVALWIGDAVYGVFAVMGLAQIIILTAVVAIAATLFAISYYPSARR